MYAEVDGWEWNGKLENPVNEESNLLDQWIVSRVHQMIEEIDVNMQKYDIPNALEPVLPFIDDASNWYVRRSRRRFWKSGDDTDKQQAYQTLHYVLMRLSQSMAPFTPFLSEELFLKLSGGQLGESVHLLDWPEVGHVNETLVSQMAYVRRAITIGLAVRADKGLKVRQPLSKVTLNAFYRDLPAELLEVVKEELNVKEIAIDDKQVKPEKTFQENVEEDNFSQLYRVELDTKLTPELKREGLMREVVRQVQSARKAAGLNVDDRISLVLTTDSAELAQAIHEHTNTIKQETLATNLTKEGSGSYETDLKVEGHGLHLGLHKAD